MKIAIITPSFLGDLERCALLCESVERFFKVDFDHFIIVENGDLKPFRGIARKNSVVLPRTDLLPDQRFAGSKQPSGWIMQQLIKLSAAQLGYRILLFLDSDVTLLKPVLPNRFIRGEQVDLFAETARNFDGPESGLMRSGPRILQIDFQRSGNQYVYPFIFWCSEIAIELRTYVEYIWKTKDWLNVLLSEPLLSEYTLYGLFFERILNSDNRHFKSNDTGRCFCRWAKPFSSNEQVAEFIASIPEDSISCLIQSNLGMPASIYAEQIRRRWELNTT